MNCACCGVAIAPSAILGRNIHVPINTGEILKSLRCMDYGNPQEQDIPAIWRSTRHWNAVWNRS
jgi:hypothetical protein